MSLRSFPTLSLLISLCLYLLLLVDPKKPPPSALKNLPFYNSRWRPIKGLEKLGLCEFPFWKGDFSTPRRRWIHCGESEALKFFSSWFAVVKSCAAVKVDSLLCTSSTSAVQLFVISAYVLFFLSFSYPFVSNITIFYRTI